MNTKKKPVNVRYMTMTAMLSAIAFVLMMLEFSIPIMRPLSNWTFQSFRH